MATFLIADDASVIRIMLGSILTSKGHEVIGEAATGTAAVEKYKELKPDIITMDITMPEMDGVTATQEIMRFDSNAKIIIVTAMTQESMLTKAIAAGAKCFILKPFNPDKVIEAINFVLAS